MQDHETLRRLVHLSGRLLDDGEFDRYGALFSATGEYRLEAAGPELPATMTWILLQKDELAALLASAPRHVWNTGSRTHMITVDDLDVQGDRAESSAGFCVFRTDQAGVTNLYAVGRYEDAWQRESEGWKLLRRVAKLKTRMLAPPSAMPL